MNSLPLTDVSNPRIKIAYEISFKLIDEFRKTGELREVLFSAVAFVIMHVLASDKYDDATARKFMNLFTDSIMQALPIARGVYEDDGKQ